MFEKYKDVGDDDLVFSYKKKKDDDVENELISRYSIHSKKLSGEFYKKFKFLYEVEFEDLYCVALASLFKAVISFSKKGFFKFWKTLAVNELNLYLKSYKLTRSDIEAYSQINVEEVSNNILLKQNPSKSYEGYNVSEDVIRILADRRYSFDEADRIIFQLYMQGFKAKEIGSRVHRTDSFVRYRLKRMKSKIADILFNQ